MSFLNEKISRLYIFLHYEPSNRGSSRATPNKFYQILVINNSFQKSRFNCIWTLNQYNIVNFFIIKMKKYNLICMLASICVHAKSLQSCQTPVNHYLKIKAETLLGQQRSSSQGYGFSSSHVWMWELGYKENWVKKNWCFWTVVLEKTLESPLDCKEIQPVHPKGDQSQVFIGRTDAEAETPILWPPDMKSWLIWKDPDAGKDWGQEEKGTTEDEMVGWHHWLNGHEFEWTPGVGDRQGGLASWDSWSCKESDMTEWLNWTELKNQLSNIFLPL